MKKPVKRKQAKKKVKNTNYRVRYVCGICCETYNNKSEVEDCCEPCDHDIDFDYFDGNEMMMYCTKCDYGFVYEIDFDSLVEYANKNHKKSKFIMKVEC